MTAELAAATSSDAPTEPGAAPRRGERWWWLGIAAITAVVAASWAPRLGLPLGDNHPGRVDARYALHLRNLREDGLLGSTWGADWEPYVTTPYAHHPPLRNLLDALFGLLPGDGLYELRLAPFLLALLSIPAAAALLRGLGIRWLPTMLAVGLLVTTGFFWIYAPLRYDLGLILALSALAVRLRHRPDPPRWAAAPGPPATPAWLVVAACVVALLTALQSWPGLAFAAGFSLWLLATRRDRATGAVAASTTAGIAVSLAYIFGIHGFGRMAEQVEVRTSGGFTFPQFLARLGEHFTDLLPVWYLLLFPVALAAGLRDRRTRFFTGLTALFSAGWVLVLRDGAYIHDYWSFLVLLPGLAGMAALLDRLPDRLPVRPAAVAVGVGLAVALAGMGFGETNREYIQRPTDSGRLLAATEPARGQEYAWHHELDAPPRWLAYYWDLPPRLLTPELLGRETGPGDLVFIDLDHLPDWLPGTAVPEPEAQRGSYVLLRAGELAEVSQPPG